jgi:hypothetical protein
MGLTPHARRLPPNSQIAHPDSPRIAALIVRFEVFEKQRQRRLQGLAADRPLRFDGGVVS